MCQGILHIRLEKSNMVLIELRGQELHLKVCSLAVGTYSRGDVIVDFSILGRRQSRYLQYKGEHVSLRDLPYALKL